MSKNISELSARQALKNNLFENLATNPDKEAIAKEFLIGKASVSGTISFYDFLKEENKDKKVYVCNGSACLCAGTQEKLTQQLEQHFDKSQIGHMTCLGRCHENSAFHYQGKNYSGLDSEQISTVLDSKEGINDSYTASSFGTSILTKKPLTIKEFEYTFKKLIKEEKAQTLNQIKISNLRGRGGAGFPISFKLESAMNAESEQKYIICNADEGDPGAYSDRYLLEQQPLLVLFGLLTSAYIIGANYGVLYIRAEYPESIAVIKKNIKALQPFIKSLDFDFKFKIISAQGAYICGEETALINSIEGQRPEVRVRPPFPTQQGLFNKPTVVNNVETLASLYSIVSKGGDFYNALGTSTSKGTKLISLNSSFNNPGIYEVEMGTSLQDVFEHCGKGFCKAIKAVQIGGPLGGIIPINNIKDLQLDFESFSDNGFLLGHASVVGIPANFPLIKYLHHLMKFAAYESCGKCFPCRLGTKRGEELLLAAIRNKQQIDKELFTDLLDTLEQGSLCAHGGGIPLPIKNALAYFSDELSDYFCN
jgi:NADH-quinone oxidoreductase subunit F